MSDMTCSARSPKVHAFLLGLVHKRLVFAVTAPRLPNPRHGTTQPSLHRYRDRCWSLLCRRSREVNAAPPNVQDWQRVLYAELRHPQSALSSTSPRFKLLSLAAAASKRPSDPTQKANSALCQAQKPNSTCTALLSTSGAPNPPPTAAHHCPVPPCQCRKLVPIREIAIPSLAVRMVDPSSLRRTKVQQSRLGWIKQPGRPASGVEAATLAV
ncbi:hypothetical protein B0T22DRAFT_180786 [Podospora appendiculata]|uniref:Uncharacterized protein n=1 Tax=Podospora appendiculata TaxID=314037 RepID=A0AAE0XCN7_9PEZI|nr:hypothetical protein B0T22DRAFT_180786 [Podospora appendiculata]